MKNFIKSILLVYLLVIFAVISCNKTKKTQKKTAVFPEIINKYKKTSETIENNSKKLNLYQEYNENDAMTELVNSKYNDNLEIYRYKYQSSLYAFSEFSISKDSSYEPFLKSEFAYQVGNKVVILSNEYIYTIDLKLCDLDKLKINPKTTVKLPKSKLNLVVNTRKLFINDEESFPFFKSYMKTEGKYKNIIVNTIEPLKKDNEAIKKLINFIKKQKITEETNKYIVFIIEENGSLFLWNKENSILFLNFTEEDLENIKDI